MAHCQHKCLPSCKNNEFPTLNKLNLKLSISSLLSVAKSGTFKFLLSCSFRKKKKKSSTAKEGTSLLPRQKHKNISHNTQEIA
jgi:hypothetical protein